MPAPKGNKHAVRPGSEKAYRVRLPNEDDHVHVALLTPAQRGEALIGYMMWLESPEADESSFLEWMKEHTDFGQFDKKEND